MTTIERLTRNKLAMWQFLRRAVQEEGCDHTFRHTQAFVAGYTSFEWAEVEPWLVGQGVHCDCEAVAMLARG
jgi:hypothetical protein